MFVINSTRRDLTWFQFGAATEEERRQASEASVSKAVIPTAKQISNKPKMLRWVSFSVGDRRHGSQEAVSQHGKKQTSGRARKALSELASGAGQ